MLIVLNFLDILNFFFFIISDIDTFMNISLMKMSGSKNKEILSVFFNSLSINDINSIKEIVIFIVIFLILFYYATTIVSSHNNSLLKHGDFPNIDPPQENWIKRFKDVIYEYQIPIIICSGIIIVGSIVIVKYFKYKANLLNLEEVNQPVLRFEEINQLINKNKFIKLQDYHFFESKKKFSQFKYINATVSNFEKNNQLINNIMLQKLNFYYSLNIIKQTINFYFENPLINYLNLGNVCKIIEIECLHIPCIDSQNYVNRRSESLNFFFNNIETKIINENEFNKSSLKIIQKLLKEIKLFSMENIFISDESSKNNQKFIISVNSFFELIQHNDDDEANIFLQVFFGYDPFKKTFMNSFELKNSFRNLYIENLNPVRLSFIVSNQFDCKNSLEIVYKFNTQYQKRVFLKDYLLRSIINDICFQNLEFLTKQQEQILNEIGSRIHLQSTEEFFSSDQILKRDLAQLKLILLAIKKQNSCCSNMELSTFTFQFMADYVKKFFN